MAAKGFLFLTIFMVVLFVYYFIKKTESKKGAFIVICGFLFWTLYLSVLSWSGILQEISLPPRMPLLVVFPVFVTIIIVTSLKGFRPFILNSTSQFFIYFQAFRIIVEVLLYIGFTEHIIPIRSTFEGINFDILVGLSAPFMGYLVQRGKLKKQGILIWNYCSLAILTVTVYSFVSYFYFMEHDPNVHVYEFVKMPYLLLPGILMPMAVFFHVLSIRKVFTKE